MIADFLLNIILLPLKLLFQVLPVISLPVIEYDSLSPLIGVISSLSFLMPLNTFVILLGYVITLRLAKLSVAIYRFIKSHIPTMGD